MNVLLLIAGMSTVTAVPRLLPALIPSGADVPPWLRRWLEMIPYAALGALIFPGILQVDRDQPWLGLVGGLTAVGLSLLNLNLFLVMSGAVGITLLCEILF